MALKKIPYKRLQQLIGLHLSTREWPDTQLIVDELSAVRKRGHLTKPELVKVCRWKSPRAIKHIKRNQANKIKRITKAGFTTRSEQKKLELLTGARDIERTLFLVHVQFQKGTLYKKP